MEIILRKLDKPISQEEAWEIIKPVCRELYDLINAENIQFASGNYNESNGIHVERNTNNTSKVGQGQISK